jgi:hypothetical protein
MITAAYSIDFNYQLEDSKIIVPLTAEVEKHHSAPYYLIKNFKAGSSIQASILPDLTIKKKKGRWVHLDSGKESQLSMLIGKSIERLENGSDPNSIR